MRYKKLWEEQQAANRKLLRENSKLREERDRYLKFIQAGHKDAFMWWLLDEMGLKLEVKRPKCVQCGLEDGACICAHLVAG